MIFDDIKSWVKGSIVVKDPAKSVVIENVAEAVVGAGDKVEWRESPLTSGEALMGHKHSGSSGEVTIRSGSVDVFGKLDVVDFIDDKSVADLTEIFLDKINENQSQIDEFNKALEKL